jgi:hypothetical protein
MRAGAGVSPHMRDLIWNKLSPSSPSRRETCDPERALVGHAIASRVAVRIGYNSQAVI